MNNIEILEKIIKRNKFIIECAGNKLQPFDLRLQEETQAIENLIQENKKLEEKAKNTMELIGVNYIHKDKIKEKIEIFKMTADYDCVYKYDYKDVIKILQELL